MTSHEFAAPHLVHVGWTVADVDLQSAWPPQLRGRKGVEILRRVNTPPPGLLLAADNHNLQQLWDRGASNGPPFLPSLTFEKKRTFSFLSFCPSPALTCFCLQTHRLVSWPCPLPPSSPEGSLPPAIPQPELSLFPLDGENNFTISRSRLLHGQRGDCGGGWSRKIKVLRGRDLTLAAQYNTWTGDARINLF